MTRSVIQQLLRGRLLYAILGLLVLFLYVRELRPSEVRTPSVGTTTPATSRPLRAERVEWWPSAEDRTEVEALIQEKPHVALMLWLLGLFGFGMAIVGAGLFIRALWTGRIRAVWRLPPRRLPAWSFGEVGRVTLLGIVMASLLPFIRVAMVSLDVAWAADPHLWMTLSMLGLDAFVVLAIAAFASGKGPTTWRGLGIAATNPWRPMGVGVRAYAAVFPWLFLLLFGTVEVSRRLGWKIPMEPIHELVFEEQRAGVLALTVLLACVVGPIAEECFFRGVLYPAIRRKTSRLTAMVASGAVFSLVHTNVLGFLPITLLGCLLAYLYERTGSLLSSMAIHVLHNTFLLSVALVMRHLL